MALGQIWQFAHDSWLAGVSGRNFSKQCIYIVLGGFSRRQSSSSSSGVEHGFAVSRVRCSNQCLSFLVFWFQGSLFSNMLVSEAEAER